MTNRRALMAILAALVLLAGVSETAGFRVGERPGRLCVDVAY